MLVGRGAFDYYRLSKRGVQTQGIAVGRRPHAQIAYSFNVTSRTYGGVGRTGIGAPPFEQISVGDKLTIHYLPDAPETNCLGTPKELFKNELGPVLMVALLFPTAIVGVAYFRFPGLGQKKN